MASKMSMQFGLLHKLNHYDKLLEEFIVCIYRCGLLLDDHQEAVDFAWKPPLSWNKPKGIMHMITGVPRNVALGAFVLKYVSGDWSALAPLGLLIPAALHCLISKLKTREEAKYTDDFKKLTTMLRKLQDLLKAVERNYNKHLLSIGNLNQLTTRALLQMVVPQMNRFLQGVAIDLVEIMSGLYQLIGQVEEALCLNERNAPYEVPFDRIDFSMPDVPEDHDYIEHHELCSLAYVYIASSFLCAVGMGLCKRHRPNVKPNIKKFLDVILPKALDVICTGYEKIAADYKRTYGTLTDSVIDVSNVQLKLLPITKTVGSFTTNIRLIFDVAQLMQLEMQQTDYANMAYILDGHCDNIIKLFSECQDMLNCLKKDVGHQMKVESVEAARRQEQSDKSAIVAAVQERVSEAASTSIIRHDDPIDVVQAEEFNLSVHGSEDESEEEEEEDKTPTAFEYSELLDCVKRQKLIIQELNAELKKRKLLTQEGEASGGDDPKKLPTARVAAVIRPPAERRNARAVAQNNAGQGAAANMNGPPLDIVPQQDVPLPVPPGFVVNVAVHAPQFPVAPPPAPPMPINNVVVPQDDIQLDNVQNFADQIQLAANDVWAGNEDIYMNYPDYEIEDSDDESGEFVTDDDATNSSSEDDL